MAAERTPTRRALLTGVAAAAGAAGLSGCKGITALGPVPKTPADVVTLEHVIAGEEAMVDLYTSARRQSSAAGEVIAAILAEHEAHLEQLRTRLVLPAEARPNQDRPEPGPALAARGPYRAARRSCS